MKLRPVTCIHVATYLFSALVLGVSAVSSCPSICAKWCWNSTRSCFIVAPDQFYITQILHWPFAETVEFRIGDPSPYMVTEAWAGMSHQQKSQLFGMTLITSELWGPPTAWSVGVPLSFLLLPPLTWMCGFHLFRLRRRWRT